MVQRIVRRFALRRARIPYEPSVRRARRQGFESRAIPRTIWLEGSRSLTAATFSLALSLSLCLSRANNSRIPSRRPVVLFLPASLVRAIQFRWFEFEGAETSTTSHSNERVLGYCATTHFFASFLFYTGPVPSSRRGSSLAGAGIPQSSTMMDAPPFQLSILLSARYEKVDRFVLQGSCSLNQKRP